MKKKQKKIRIMSTISMVALVLALALATFGLSSTIGEIDGAVISRSPEVILANAGVSEDKDVFLSVSYFDQKSDKCVNVYDLGLKEELSKRQFEWDSCDYYNKDIEKGLVDYYLGENLLPVGKSGVLVSNRGLNNMEGWFEKVDGKSEAYTGTLKMNYKNEGAEFSFHKDEFYPLDEVEFSKGDVVNKDGHNHLFTMNFAVPFTTLGSGNESFDITADDDTFVYVGDRLVIDMGGIHGATTGRFVIEQDGEVYSAVEDEELAYTGVKLNKDDGSIVRIFHADRNSAESVFKVRFAGMSIGITDTKLANREEDGLQIAYDPTDPTYVAPLGESSVVKPDGTRGYIVIATIEGVMILIFAILMTVIIRDVVRRRLEQKTKK